MWHRKILCQLVLCPQQHIHNIMLKAFCVGCTERRLFIDSRRTFTSDENKDAHGIGLLKSNAQILWDYLRIDNQLKKSDLIFILGNSDLRTADYAAKLYTEGYAPLVAVSGREGHKTRGKWLKPEAVIFAEKLVQNGVPTESIVLEPRATNTGENIRFMQKLLKGHPDFIQPQSVILVQTPFMGRRCLATFQKQWERADLVDVMISSPPISLKDYPSPTAGYASLTDIAIELVRSVHRIQLYPEKGYQVAQHVPSRVLEALEELQQQLELKDENIF